MLLEEAEDLPEQTFVADLERIHFAGRRLLNVINDLFDPTKSAAYKSDPNLVHHEIRTPLNQIIGYAEMLQEEAQERGTTAFVADFEKILTAARELLRLVVENFAGPEMELGGTENQPAAAATTFTRREIVTPLATTRMKGHPGSDGAGGSLLVVDDDEGNRAMLARRLIRLGYRVTVAEDGR